MSITVMQISRRARTGSLVLSRGDVRLLRWAEGRDLVGWRGPVILIGD